MRLLGVKTIADLGLKHVRSILVSQLNSADSSHQVNTSIVEHQLYNGPSNIGLEGPDFRAKL